MKLIFYDQSDHEAAKTLCNIIFLLFVSISIHILITHASSINEKAEILKHDNSNLCKKVEKQEEIMYEQDTGILFIDIASKEILY